ncbi:hypothetical protein HPB50_023994 [Hyalomma asiaticum]|uniref:Uncharacterized protein n=1 Tax=Hyalomma asiaticum TaxID=266040 RepID=A0ACB7SF90_HYAAI|nr:hypothetical protein HPB50_023994 [Hyalomma asiaticum]
MFRGRGMPPVNWPFSDTGSEGRRTRILSMKALPRDARRALPEDKRCTTRPLQSAKAPPSRPRSLLARSLSTAALLAPVDGAKAVDRERGGKTCAIPSLRAATSQAAWSRCAARLPSAPAKKPVHRRQRSVLRRSSPVARFSAPCGGASRVCARFSIPPPCMLRRLGPCARPKTLAAHRLDDDTCVLHRGRRLNTASSAGVRRRDFSRACAASPRRAHLCPPSRDGSPFAASMTTTSEI